VQGAHTTERPSSAESETIRTRSHTVRDPRLSNPPAAATQGLSCYVLLLEEAAGRGGRVPAREVEAHLLAVGLVRVRVRSVFEG
jgi:hypothetical protein